MAPPAEALAILDITPEDQTHTIERAHRALQRRYMPNEMTPPAAAPRYRNIESAYATLQRTGPPSLEQTESQLPRRPSRLTAPAFIHAGIGCAGHSRALVEADIAADANDCKIKAVDDPVTATSGLRFGICWLWTNFLEPFLQWMVMMMFIDLLGYYALGPDSPHTSRMTKRAMRSVSGLVRGVSEQTLKLPGSSTVPLDEAFESQGASKTSPAAPVPEELF